ncbi:hypothetical protein [Celeribacter sp. ULVN23_4]
MLIHREFFGGSRIFSKDEGGESDEEIEIQLCSDHEYFETSGSRFSCGGAASLAWWIAYPAHDGELLKAKQKLKKRLDQLEADLNGNRHLKSGDAQAEIQENLARLQIYRRILTEEEVDFLNCAAFAIEERRSWNKN